MPAVRASRLLLVLVCGAALGCRETRSLPACTEAPPASGPTVDAGGDPVLLAAGDIAYSPDLTGARATAKVLDGLDGHVLALGDNAYENGSVDDYLDYYAPTWGRHRWRTHPAIGNHEWQTPEGGGYFAYFCAAAGTPFKGWYSLDVGAWHLVAINSNCGETGFDAPSCDRGSEQETWLRADLAAHPAKCTLAYWHHPRFGSGNHGNNDALQSIWQALYDAGAELVLNGHQHNYERFSPQTPTGGADGARGIREFVVGTGGADLTAFVDAKPNSELRKTGVYGVIKLTLHAEGYDWQFVSVDGSFTDTGSGSCH
jgi:hypothetical protein